MRSDYSVSDFALADVEITKIHSVQYVTTDNWGRPVFSARQNDGLVLLTKGNIKYNFNDETLTAGAGDILIFPKGLTYSGVKFNGKTNSFYVVDFDSNPLNNSYADFPVPTVCHIKNYALIEKRFQKLLEIWESGVINNKLKSKAMLFNLLSDVLLDYAENVTPEKELSKISKITEYLNQNYSNSELCISKICEEFYLSESTLRRMFMKTFGLSPIEYITDIRINAAKNMILYDNIPIGEVATKCGFSSLYYFSRIFKRRVGTPPSEYRK